jgi:hypothetical protein
MLLRSSKRIYLFSAPGFSSSNANAISFPKSNALLPSRKEVFSAKTGFDASRVLERLCALRRCYLD